MTDNLKEREAFEAWFNKHHTGNDLARDGDDYEDFSFTQRLWMGWQGRSAIAQAQSCVPAEQTTRPANSQEWAGMDASTAYLLICRHADGWADIDLMMNEWRLANPSPQPQPVQPSERAQDLHEKASMPWGQAEKLALEEAGIGDAEIDELIGEASNSVLIGLLDKEDVREFVRSILVHQPSAVTQAKPEQAAQPKARTPKQLADDAVEDGEFYFNPRVALTPLPKPIAAPQPKD